MNCTHWRQLEVCETLFYLLSSGFKPRSPSCGRSPLTAGAAIFLLKLSCSYGSLDATFQVCGEAWLTTLSKDKTASIVYSISAQLPDLLRLQTQMQNSDCLQFEQQGISGKTLGKKHRSSGAGGRQRQEIKNLTAKCHLIYDGLLIG